MVEVDTGENISNAVKVLSETYQSMEKMFSELRSEADKQGLKCRHNYPMRWRTDQYSAGWWVRNLIHVFESGIPNKTGLDYVYVVEVDLEGWSTAEIRKPTVVSSAFLFKQPPESGYPSSISDHWLYYYPVRQGRDFTPTQLDDSNFYKSSPINDSAKEKYLGLMGVISTVRPLVSLTNRTDIEQLISDLPGLRDKAISEFGKD